jgi:hypothetical protein
MTTTREATLDLLRTSARATKASLTAAEEAGADKSIVGALERATAAAEQALLAALNTCADCNRQILTSLCGFVEEDDGTTSLLCLSCKARRDRENLHGASFL